MLIYLKKNVFPARLRGRPARSFATVRRELDILEIDNLLTTLYLSNSPYEIREGIRYIRNTDKLLKGTSNKITAIDSNKKTFSPF